jgi:hypothetical protein
MHHLGHCHHVVNGRLRQDAMAEVEDMAGAAPRPPQNVIHPTFDLS